MSGVQWDEASPRFQVGHGESAEGTEKIKNRLLSAWNNVCNGFSIKVKTNFSKYQPVYLLGQLHGGGPKIPSEERREGESPKWVRTFKEDVCSRIWLTYRRGFPSLGSSSQFTSDTGWGCMIRAGQMLLAQGLVMHFLGRDWRWSAHRVGKKEQLHRMILSWFADSRDPFSPLSLHHLVAVGENSGKVAGNWYGPATVVQIIRSAVHHGAELCPELDQLRVYVAQDLSVYVDDVKSLCTDSNDGARNEPTFSMPLFDIDETFSNTSSGSGSLLSLPDSMEAYLDDVRVYPELPEDSSLGSLECHTNGAGVENRRTRLYPSLSDCKDDEEEPWRPLIMFIPMRLGGEKLNQDYIPLLKLFLTWPQCIGIIGGKPKHALYFMGWQEEHIIYLDPHFCQETVSKEDPWFPLDSYHCSSPRKILFEKMDPSSAVGFYCHDFSSLQDLINKVKQAEVDGCPPLFQFFPGKRPDASTIQERKNSAQDGNSHADDFVFL